MRSYKKPTVESADAVGVLIKLQKRKYCAGDRFLLEEILLAVNEILLVVKQLEPGEEDG